MYSEHLQNVRAGWVLAGWAVAAAVTSLLFLGMVSFGLIGVGKASEVVWVVLLVAAGFLAGGFFVGTRAIDAPVLHGIGIGLTSLLAWFVLNLLGELLPGSAGWVGLSPTVTAALALEQLVAAVSGTWLGRWVVLRGAATPGA